MKTTGSWEYNEGDFTSCGCWSVSGIAANGALVGSVSGSVNSNNAGGVRTPEFEKMVGMAKPDGRLEYPPGSLDGRRGERGGRRLGLGSAEVKETALS